MAHQLCRGRPPEWWSPDDGGARLALDLCRVCPNLGGCPAGDPTPHGVIRAAVAYSDAGSVLPLCGCGYPVADYLGGPVHACKHCRVPDVPIPNRKRMRALAARCAVRDLARAGIADADAALRLGISPRTVRAHRVAAGQRRPPGPAPRQVAA